MNIQRFNLPVLRPDSTRRLVGIFGELFVTYSLRERGFFAGPAESRKAGDVRAIFKPTGEILRLEVKTARKDSGGKWQFCLRKRRKTDIDHADFLVLLALDGQQATPYIIPTNELPASQHQIRISSGAKYARWRADALELERYL